MRWDMVNMLLEKCNWFPLSALDDKQNAKKEVQTRNQSKLNIHKWQTIIRWTIDRYKLIFF